MTSEQEITDQVNKDYNRFWYSAYDGELPSGIIEKFRQAIMYLNAISLQGAPQVLKDIIGRKEDDLKFVHVGIILNTLFSIPLNAIFYSPEEALDTIMEFKEIEIEYNKRVEVKQKEIERKRARLLDLSGITKTTTNFNNNGTPRKN